MLVNFFAVRSLSTKCQVFKVRFLARLSNFVPLLILYYCYYYIPEKKNLDVFNVRNFVIATWLLIRFEKSALTVEKD